jgi:hypothetical protein
MDHREFVLGFGHCLGLLESSNCFSRRDAIGAMDPDARSLDVKKNQ